MYLCALLFERVFFVLCQVYSGSRHLKNAPFAASTGRPQPPPRLRPAYLNKENAPRVRHTVNPSTRRSNPARVGLRLVAFGQCVNVRRACALSNYGAKVLLFSHICKYICIKICSIGEFCVAPFVSLQNTFQYSEFSLYFKYPFPLHTHFCPI